MCSRKIIACWMGALVILGTLLQNANAQSLSKLDRARAEQMLQAIASDVTKHYYDPKINGVDWRARVAEYKQKLDSATSMNMALSVIAATLDSLNDTHTYFLPPDRPYIHDFGWNIQVIGNRCFVTEVRPGSDAESKGVKPGDQVLSIDGYDPSPENLWRLKYIFDLLRPQPSLGLVLLSPMGQQRQVDITAKIEQRRYVRDERLKITCSAQGAWQLGVILWY